MFEKLKRQRNFLWPKTLDIKNLSTTKSRYNLETVVKIILNLIFNYNSIKLVIINDENLLDECSSENCKLQAMLEKSDSGYRIIIRKNPIEEPANILCHELIHLDQIERGDLILTQDMKTVVWKNNQYDYNFPYAKRPWEIEAINRTFIIKKKLTKIYYE